jgi:putative restriction endonuclease
LVDLFIGNTDNDWFDFLASQNDISEVNFWKPSSSGFSAISEGEMFAFRLKSPRDKIGGFGFFNRASVLPIQTAWEAFGTANGVPNQTEMLRLISRYRPNERVSASTFIGCRILLQPVFLPPHLWLDLPNSWSSNIVGGKRYSTESEEGSNLWSQLMNHARIWEPSTHLGLNETGARFGDPVLVTPRLGQGAFRIAITEAYGRQCALTDGKVLPALDAAHIRPFSEGGSHNISNGILLRKDIHSVFDSGYATIDEGHRFVVSEKVRDVFNNGNEYRRLHGQKIRLPDSAAYVPSQESLRWHNTNRFLG